MTKISNNKAKIGKGQRVKLGSNSAYEVYQNPATGQLEIIDTKNNSRALVDKEDRGQIGGNGTFIKALKNGEPMADTGKTYSTVQGAVDAASSWVFVPPGTYNESVTVETEGLTLRGAGYTALINGESSTAINIESSNIDISQLSLKTSGPSANCTFSSSSHSNILLKDCVVRDSGQDGISLNYADGSKVINCIVKTCSRDAIAKADVVSDCIIKQSGKYGVYSSQKNGIYTNNIVKSTSNHGLDINQDNCVTGGNRVIDADGNGVNVTGKNCIVFNNRISGSSGSDINTDDSCVTDGNLTGSAN